MHDRSRYCENKLISSAPWVADLWLALCGFSLIILGMTQQTVFAQEVDTLRKGVVKVTATADGKQKTGAGFIIQHDAQATYIVTASHVVAGDKYPKVAFFSQRHSLIEAEVLQNDQRSDISLLKIRDNIQVPADVVTLMFSAKENVKDNDELIAIGFPASVDWARVPVTLASRQGADLILNGNIDEGNSGGPVLKNGEIVGLITNTTKFSRAIPAKFITMVLEGWGITLAEGGEISVKNITQPPHRDSSTSTPITTKPTTETRLPIEPEMVLILPGGFLMGSRETEIGRYSNEHPQHEVTIAYAFEISKYEVTFDEYDTFARTTNKRKLPNDKGWGRGKRPVINVSYNDAQAYVQWLSQQTGKKYRLPTEAEWEYAARAGTQTRYWWGDAIGNNNAVCESCGSQWDNKKTAPVGSFKANAFGLYDSAGNVEEWVQDCWHGYYINAPTDGSAWLEANDGNCTARVVRGGSWNSIPQNLRSANRNGGDADAAYFLLGFRIARTL